MGNPSEEREAAGGIRRNAATRTAGADAKAPEREHLYRADRELVLRALGDESAALEELSERLERVPPVLAALNARLGRPLDDHELADLSQEVLVRVWRKLSSFAGRSRLETWVHGICRLELMNASRRKRRLARPVLGIADGAQPDPPANDPPPAMEFEHVHAGLERLGPPEADVVRLKHFDGLTFEEIGAVLGISSNTAKTQYYRGLEKLRVYLRGQGEGGGA